jgi:outer membrane protein TolC
VLRGEVNVGNAKPAVLRFTREVRDALSQLNVLMGRQPQEALKLAGELKPLQIPNLDAGRLVGLALEQRTDLRQIALQRDMIETTRKIVQAQNKPGLYYMGNMGLASLEEGELFEEDSEEWMVGLSFSWTLFDGFETREKMKGLYLSMESVDQMALAAADQARLEVETGVHAVEVATEMLKAMEGNVQTAEEALRIAEDNYEVGLTTSLDVMEAQAGLAKAKMEFVQAVYEQALGCARLLWVTGEFDGPEAMERLMETVGGNKEP